LHEYILSFPSSRARHHCGAAPYSSRVSGSSPVNSDSEWTHGVVARSRVGRPFLYNRYKWVLREVLGAADSHRSPSALGNRSRLLLDGSMLPTRANRFSAFWGVICVTTHDACSAARVVRRVATVLVQPPLDAHRARGRHVRLRAAQHTTMLDDAQQFELPLGPITVPPPPKARRAIRRRFRRR
jgi:hypothetical protein